MNVKDPKNTVSEIAPALRALLEGVFDYAGLFPPAKLGMAETVSNYATYLAGEHSWMLGRLIVPVARLDEFESSVSDLLPHATGADRVESGSGTRAPRPATRRCSQVVRRALFAQRDSFL